MGIIVAVTYFHLNCQLYTYIYYTANVVVNVMLCAPLNVITRARARSAHKIITVIIASQ